MTERGEVPPARRTNEYHNKTYEYFLYSDPRAEELAEYKSEGLAYTNNLHLYFVDEPDEWLIEGKVRNPHDWRQRPFGPIIRYFRDNYPELWEEVKQSAANYRKAHQEWLLLKQQGQDLTAIEVRLDALEYLERDAKSRAFDILAPMLEACDIDPLDILK